MDHAKEPLFGRADYRHAARARRRCEHEGGLPQVRHLRRTFYKYKAKFGGMSVSDAQRLKVLELENSRLKRLLADAMLDNAALKDIAAKNF